MNAPNELPKDRGILRFATACLMFLLVAPMVHAQQTTGVPGSPSATTTIDGRQLPPPDPKFGGLIKENAADSKPWWAPRVVPPKGAPNVLLIMTDDVGFGAPSTFGGVIPTPALDRIAMAGLRYTQFHSTALCSPTRAALITGRNHHSTGFGVISEQSTGFPGYNSIIPKDIATIGEILKENGYATSWFGKDHNTPTFTASQAGPFDQWPIGMGFEYFYGCPAPRIFVEKGQVQRRIISWELARGLRVNLTREELGVWGATEQKTGLSTGCRQPLDRRDVNIERLGAVPYILSLVQLVELPGRPNCTSRFLATLRARVGCASVPARLSRPELGQSSCTIFAQVLAKGSVLRDTAANENSLLWAIRSNACQFPERGPKDPLRPLRR